MKNNKSDSRNSKYTILVPSFAGTVGEDRKDAVIDWFCENHGFREIRLDAPIKAAVKDFLNLTEDHVNNPKKDTFYRAVQLLGSCGRDIDPYLWINKVLTQIVETNHSRWIITNCFQFNELEGIKKAGGTLLQVVFGDATRGSDTVFDEIIDVRLDLGDLYSQLKNSKTVKALVNDRMRQVLDYYGGCLEDCVVMTTWQALPSRLCMSSEKSCITRRRWAENVAKNLDYPISTRPATPEDFSLHEQRLSYFLYGEWLSQTLGVVFNHPTGIIPESTKFWGTDGLPCYASSGYEAQEEVIRRTAREVSHREDIVGVHQEVLDFVWGNWAHTPTAWRGCHNSAFVGDYGTRWDVLPEEE